MRHIAYYEPCYNDGQPNLWQLRGQYKYPSILGDLRHQARLTILMHQTPPANDPLRIRLEQDFGVRFTKIAAPNNPGPGRGDRLAKVLVPELKRIGADIVSNLNGRTLTYCYASAIAAKQIGIRYVMRVGGDDLTTKAHVFESADRSFAGSPQYYQLMQEERLATELSDDVIVMTQREKARLACIAEAPDKIHVCYRGVDQSAFNGTARTGPCRKFLFIGRRSAEKGYDILEAAAREVYALDRSVTFTFAGTFDKAEEDNRNYIGYVNFKDLPALYAEHDAVIVCSRTEGFPQVLMEAMSMGLPCIMSRHLFQKDFVEEQNALFTNIDPTDLVANILRLTDQNSGFYEALSARTLAHAREHFDEGRLVRRYHSIVLGDRASHV